MFISEDRSMSISSIKYQIVVSHEGGCKMVMETYHTLEVAELNYQIAKRVMESGTGSMIMRDPDWNRLELQRVEVLEG